MDDKWRAEIMKRLEVRGKVLSQDKEESRKFLMRIGILNRKGKLTKRYSFLTMDDPQDWFEAFELAGLGSVL